MKTYTALIEWSCGEDEFTKSEYSRVHSWTFDSGDVIKASASPHIVPEPYSTPDAVDPEEAFIASISSCHMLWFLAIVSKRDYKVDQYTDRAKGVMGKNDHGRLAIAKVDLYPVLRFSGDRIPDDSEIQSMHREAHEKCFIANSVRTEITVHLESEPN